HDPLTQSVVSTLFYPARTPGFGADAVVGLVPGIGYVVTPVLSAYIVFEASRLGAPAHLIARMIANVAVASMITAVPVAGSVADVFFRANRRNMRILREWLERAGLV